MPNSNSSSAAARFSDKLKSYPLYVLPHHAISRLVYVLTRLRTSLVRPVIRWFIRTYQVEMQDAEVQDITHFASFNDFFTRALKPGARPLAEGDLALVSPVDATVSQSGHVEHGQVFQAKGHRYSLEALLGGPGSVPTALKDAAFTTLYLSPRDYHRIHMPVTGKLTRQTHIPGRLYSVAPHTVNTIPGLFAKNERVVAFFDTEFGPLALVLVGAINVAAIETVWHGLVTPPTRKRISTIDYPDDQSVQLMKGQEMGRFNMGSTVIVVAPSNVRWDEGLTVGAKVRMGEKIGFFDSES